MAAGSRISVEITGSSTELQAAVARAGDSLKGLGDVLARQSELAVKAGDQTISANDLVAKSYEKAATAAGAASESSTAAAERQAAGFKKSIGAQIDQLALFGDRLKEQAGQMQMLAYAEEEAYARTADAAKLSADEQVSAAARATDAAKVSADEQVAASERQSVAQDASAAAATRSAAVKSDASKRSAQAFGAEGSALTNTGKKITLGLLGIGAASVYMAVKFQANTLRMQTQAGATAGQLDKLRKGILDMAGAVGYTPNQLADGMYHVVSAMNATLPPTQRVSGELTVMAQAARLAHVGNSNLEETTYALVSAMNALHEPVAKAGQVASQLNAIVGAGDMTMQDLVDSFSSGLLPAAKTAGISLQSVGAAMATMGDLGMRGALAGTRLRMSIALLSSPSEAAAKVLDTLGMSSKQATSTSAAMAAALEKAGLRTTTLSQDLRQPDGILVALQDLKSHLESSGLTATGAAAVMNKAFGGGRMGATITLLADSTSRLQTKFQQIGHDANPQIWSADWNRWLHSSQGEIDTFKSGIASLGTKLGTDLLPAFNTGIHDLSEFIDFLEKGSTAAHVLEGVVGTFALVTIGSYFTSKVKQAITLVKDLKTGLTSMMNLGGKMLGVGGPSTTSTGAARAQTDEMIAALDRVQVALEQTAAALDRNIIAVEKGSGGGIMSGLEHVGIGGARSGLGLPGSVPNPLITATEAGEYAGLGSMGAAGTVATEEHVAQAETGAVEATGAKAAVTGGVAAAEAAPVAEEALGGAGLLASLKSGLPSVISGAMKGGMLALGGGLISQLAGSAIGGKAGKDVSTVGTSAAIGAGLGSMLGPEGTIAGGVLGGLVGAFQTFLGSDADKYGTDIANAITKNLPVAVSSAYTAGLAKTANDAQNQAQTAKMEKPGGLLSHPTRGNISATAIADALKGKTAGAEAAAEYASLGTQAGTAFAASFAQVKYKSTPAFFNDFMAVANKLPAQSRDAAAKTAIEFAQGLVDKGQLPKDAVQNLIFGLESQFPGLQSYLKSQGDGTAKDVADSMKMSAAVSNLQQTVNTMKSTFGAIPADFGGDMQVTGTNMSTKLQQAMTVLKTDMTQGTTAMRQAATQQYAQLEQQASSDMSALVTQTADKMGNIKTAVATNSTQAAQIGSSAFQALATNIANYVGSGAEATGKGLASITAQVNAELKSFGEKGLSAVQVAAATPAQLAALVSGQVSAGGLASPHAAGGVVGNWGEKSRDQVPIMVGRGEAVLNHQQQRVVNSALSATGLGSLQNVFSQTSGTRHWMASGGFVVGASEFGGPNDPSTHGSDSGAYGTDVTGSIARLQSGGAYFSKFAPGSHWTLTAPGGKSIVATVTDMGSGGGSVGAYPRAIDLWWQTANALGLPGTAGTWTGLLDVTPAGTAGSAPGGGGAAFTAITAPKVSGTGVVASLTQDALDKAAAGANSYLQSKVPAATGGVSLLPGAQRSEVSPKNAPGALQAMIGEANAIASHNYNYEWGGGHGSIGVPTHGVGHGSGPGVGFDCSGAVSAVLHSGGLLGSPEVAAQFMSYGDQGPGKWVSLFASPSHVFMELAGHYFGTSTAENPGGGANWIPTFPEAMPAVRHPPGFDAGGFVFDISKLSQADQMKLASNPYATLPGMDEGGYVDDMTADAAKTHFPTGVPKPPKTPKTPKPPKAPGAVASGMTTKDMQELSEIGGTLNQLEQWITGLSGTYSADTTLFGPEEAQSQYLNADGSLNAAGYAKKIADDQTLLGLDQQLLSFYNQEVPIVSGALTKWLGKQSKLQGTIKTDTSKIDANKRAVAANKIKEGSIRTAMLDLQKPTPNTVQTIEDQISKLRLQYDGEVSKAERAQTAYLGPEESYLNKLKANVLAAQVSRNNYTGTDKATIKRLNQAVTDARLAETNYENSQAPAKAALALAVKNAHQNEQLALSPLQGALLAAKVKQQQRAYRIKVEKFGLQQQLGTLTRDDTKLTSADTDLGQTVTGLKGILTGAGGGQSTNTTVNLLETVAGKLGMVEWGSDGSFVGIDTAMPGEIVSVKADILSLQNDIGQTQTDESGVASASTTADDSALVSLLEEQNLQLTETLALNEAQTAALASMIPEIPAYASGGPVLDDGLAMVHQGEYVVPRAGALVGGGTTSVASPDVHIHVHGDSAGLIKTIRSEIARPQNVRSVSRGIGQRTSMFRSAPGGFR